MFNSMFNSLCYWGFFLSSQPPPPTSDIKFEQSTFHLSQSPRIIYQTGNSLKAKLNIFPYLSKSVVCFALNGKAAKRSRTWIINDKILNCKWESLLMRPLIESRFIGSVEECHAQHLLPQPNVTICWNPLMIRCTKTPKNAEHQSN